jgi:hypothetical protein
MTEYAEYLIETAKNGDANAKISARIIITFILNGGDMKAAVDEILGDGTYELVGADVYDALKGQIPAATV